MLGSVSRSALAVPSRALQATLGGTATALLAVKTGLAPLPIEDVVSLVLLGATAEFDAVAGVLLFAFNLALVFLTAYSLSRSVLGWLPVPGRSFWGLLAGTAAVYAGSILVLRTAASRGGLLVPLLLVFFASLLAFAAYLRLAPAQWKQYVRSAWSALSTRPAVDDGGELPTTRTELWAALLTVAAVGALGSLVSGILGTALLLFSPALEVVVLFWVLAGALLTARRPAERTGSPSRRIGPPDVDSRLFGVLRHLGTEKGNFTTLLVVVGVIVATVPAVVAIEVGTAFLAESRPAAPLAAWNATGLVLSLLLIAGYSLRFWLRVVARLPAFLRAWRGDPGPPDDPLPVRPPGLLAPLLVVCLPAGLYLSPAGSAVSAAPAVGYALGWPAASAILVWVAARTSSLPAQPPLSEEYALPVAFAVQVGGVLFVLPYDFPPLRAFLVITGLCLGAFYAPSLSRWVGAPAEPSPLLVHLGYYTGLGALLGLLATGSEPPVAPTALLFAVVLFLYGAGRTLVTYLTAREAPSGAD